MSYIHKSGAQKRRDRKSKEEIGRKGQVTFESMGFFPKNSLKSACESIPCSQSREFEAVEVAAVEKQCPNFPKVTGTVLSQESTSFIAGSSNSAHINEKCDSLPIENAVNTSLTAEPELLGGMGEEISPSFLPGEIHNETAAPPYTVDSAEVHSSGNLENPHGNSHEFASHEEIHAKFTPSGDFDVGTLTSLIVTQKVIEDAILRGPCHHPKNFPKDIHNHPFPRSVLTCTLKNGETISRDYLVWSPEKNSLFCFPCRLLSKIPAGQRSLLALPDGYSHNNNWRKLYDRITPHENSCGHKACYMQWKTFENSLQKGSAVDMRLGQIIKDETEKWRQILRRILDVTLFLGERGLAFRGNSHLLGHPRNGNFLGILELLSHYDPVLEEHLKKVRSSQEAHKRLQVHYLSPDSQNEFIECCADQVRNAILKEREEAKYYALMVDATPDTAHVEQTVFILRYVSLTNAQGVSMYVIRERFLAFVDCNKKTGEGIADLIRQTLAKHHIDLSDARGQGYDNGSNMKGQYKGVQARLLNDNPLALFSPCACHSLNLCGVQAAESCVEAVSFFGNVQKCFNIFSSSPARWEALQDELGCSLHSISDTRWSARIDCVKPFSTHLPQIKNAIQKIRELNLTSETLNDLNGIEKYISSFECFLMASIWFKVLKAIDNVNKVLQAKEMTLDLEVNSLNKLLEDLQKIRNSWDSILGECKQVCESLKMTPDFSAKRHIRKRLADGSMAQENSPPEDIFRTRVFYVLVDCVISNISTRYTAVQKINNLFSFLWNYPKLTVEDMLHKAKKWLETYTVDASEELCDEMEHLKSIQPANFAPNLNALQLLNTLEEQKLKPIYPNVCIALRIFCTLPVTVAQAERSFSALARIKNVLRSTMGQDRLSGLGSLAMEPDLARSLNFDNIIDRFASKKARKAIL